MSNLTLAPGTWPAWLVAATDHIGRGTYCEDTCTLPADTVSMDHTAPTTTTTE